MARYHISPRTGLPNKCTAKNKCPLGGSIEKDHYNSKEEARAAYEEQMNKEILTKVSRKNSNVISMGGFKKSKVEDGRSTIEKSLEENKIKENFDLLPLNRMTKGEVSMLEKVVDGEEIPSKKLDTFIEKYQGLTSQLSHSTPEKLEATKNLLTHLKHVRSSDLTPNTLPTLSNFNPATQSVFSNSQARKNAMIAGRAIRREHEHGEWMRELANEEQESVKSAQNSEEIKEFLSNVKLYEGDAQRSDAKLHAQLIEVQWLAKNNTKYSGTMSLKLQNELPKFLGKASKGSDLHDIPILGITKIGSILSKGG